MATEMHRTLINRQRRRILAGFSTRLPWNAVFYMVAASYILAGYVAQYPAVSIRSLVNRLTPGFTSSSSHIDSGRTQMHWLSCW
jgi:hypothetical protein